MRRMKPVQLGLKRTVFFVLPVTLLLSLVQVIYSAPANASAPRAASLIGRTGGELINYTGDAACRSAPRGITNDGTFIYFRTNLTATSQTICKTTLSGVYVAHQVITDSSISGDQRDMAYSNGCLIIPDSGTAPNTGLKCILASNLSEVVALTIPIDYPMIQKTTGWMIRNIADLPDGRIGFMGEPSGVTGNAYPNYNGVDCPAGKFCKVFRTYGVTGTAPNLILSFSQDYVLQDTSASWPNDEHGIASNGTYLYEIRHLGGYRVWTLSDSETSPMAFNGHLLANTTDTVTPSVFNLNADSVCQASTGVDSNCSIRFPESGTALTNVTFMTHNHQTNRYIVGDYNAPITPTSAPLFYMTPGVQEITFNAISTTTFGESPFLLSASDTSTSGTAPTYTSQTLAVCSVSTRTVTIVGAGTCTITASVVGSGPYNSATAQQSFTVNKAAQSGFLLSSTSGTYLTNLRLLSSGGNDTGTVSFAVGSVGTAGCSITNSDSLTSTSAGTCQVLATKAATNNYLAAYDTQTVTIGKASITLTISVTGSSTVKYGSSAATSFTTNRSLGTGNIETVTGTIAYSTVNSTACSINSSTGAVLMTAAAGACSVRVSLASDPNYSDTSSVVVVVTPAKADAITVTSGNTSATFTGSTVSVSPSFSVSGLVGSDTVTVGFRYFGTDNGGDSYYLDSTAPTYAGTYVIAPLVSQINSDSYTTVANVVNGLLTIDRASRTLAATTYNSSTLKYGESASVVSNSVAPSTDPIDGAFSYAIGSGCSINSSTGVVTATSSTETCSQTTTIGQGNNYLSATSPPVSFTLSKADTLTVTSSTPSAVVYTGSAASVSPSVTVSGLVNSDTASGATYNYSRASTCATGGTCSVGDTGPGGGIVFYLSNTAINAADGISAGGRYLEAAPSTLSKPIIQWCTGGSNPFQTLIGGTSNAIGFGANNTKIMLANCTGGAGYSAADLTLNSKSDWFLPSYDEQTQMYLQKNLLNLDAGTPSASNSYWGSSETANWHASSIVPATGIGVQSKIDSISYWPIRAFSPIATAYSSSTTAPTNVGSYTITPSSLTLSGGRSTENYIAITYETSTMTINKANQSIFSDYSSLEAVLGSAFQIYPFGGSGDGAVYLGVANGTGSSCSASTSSVTAGTAGTCILTITKSANENYNQAQATFTITFFYFVPAAAAPVSTRPTDIAVSSTPSWSSTATAVPSITSFTPSSGGAGTVVTITGVGLDGVTSVKIGRRALTSVRGDSSTSVTAVIPAGATSGPLVVTNSFGSDFSSSNFTVSP